MNEMNLRYKNMKNKIIYYKQNGDIDHEELLNEESLAHTNGMMLKCYMKNGIKEIGFSDPYRTHDNDFDDLVHDYINLWTWDNLDENKHELIGNDDSRYNQSFKKVMIDNIVCIEAILYSNPRWGGRLTNSFDYFTSRFTNNKK